ncbi:DUF2017 domain-containing protein [Microbacterium terricola]|uniref:DUF2017 domain-containing protein n=1 Tax=Microbacterium terricola TaxID=344163 RepID=A0ABM8DYW2_9MICO|nr:DUF2017 domain-containing protein [Microbacterium terricola]UYK41418.1 DUF2017 domain-containing protein [Microbacterium terricola]BDV30794.1 hypothetical protein Microterr_14540 [Microbacterium terricola]
MSTPPPVVLELSRLEATHLSGLVGQFAELLAGAAASDRRDPAFERLSPDAYPDDPEAGREFRALTEGDLRDGRIADAALVQQSLADAADLNDVEQDDPRLLEERSIVLDPDGVRAWLRTLAAIRLVLATRLGIDEDDHHADGDPRFGIYDWVGYRLDGLVRAIDRP